MITKIKILDGGKGQVQNPHRKTILDTDRDDRLVEPIDNPDWHEFDKANPAYDIISPLSVKVGETVDAELIWQHSFGSAKRNIWLTRDVGENGNKTFAQFQSYWFDRKTRLAWQLTPEKEGEEKRCQCNQDWEKGECQYWEHDMCVRFGAQTLPTLKEEKDRQSLKRTLDEAEATFNRLLVASHDVDEKDFVPIICGDTCGCKHRLKSCPIGKGNQLNTPLRFDEVKKPNAITYEQILTLPNNEHGHKFQPGYDNLDGNHNYFGTSPDAMRVMTVNANYVGHTFVNIKKDGGTRTVFNGHVRSFEELKLINSLVL